MVEVGTTPVADRTMLAPLEHLRLANIALVGRPVRNVVFLLLEHALLLDMSLKSDGRIGGVTNGN